MAETFQFDLVSPERRLLSEAVERVDVPGSEGQFGVLAGHAPFMATLRPGVLTAHKPGGAVERIFVRGGFADVNPAGLTILAEQAMPVAELNAAAIAAEIRNLEEDLSDARTDEARQAATLRLAQMREVEVALKAG